MFPPERAAVENRLCLEMLSQPDETTCGPTCLHAVYRYFGHDVPLEDVIREVPSLEGGGTLAVFLGCHALRHGYRVRIYTYNLQLFDPTWFAPGGPDLRERLVAQMRAKGDAKLRRATEGYLEFLDLGGELRLEDLTPGLIRAHLDRGVPIVTGLSATYLYRGRREVPGEGSEDDVRGEPSGHFVVLCGYDRARHTVLVADPFHPNPFADTHLYEARVERVLCSILLGVITYDAKLLIVRPRTGRSR